MMRFSSLISVWCLIFLPAVAFGQATRPATQAVGKLPHITVDARNKQVRVDCFAVKADYPLEFLAVVSNTNEYEAIVRSDAKPSDLHLALLMIGLKPGHPASYDKEHDKWDPPTGPLVRISFEYQKEGKAVRVPASQWMVDVDTGKPPEDLVWCFTGSRFVGQGEYGANETGQLISVVNNDLSVLDVPVLKSRSIESRQWKRSEAMPPTNTPVTMILAPAEKDAAATQAEK